jgi:hypothetical protein
MVPRLFHAQHVVLSRARRSSTTSHILFAFGASNRVVVSPPSIGVGVGVDVAFARRAASRARRTRSTRVASRRVRRVASRTFKHAKHRARRRASVNAAAARDAAHADADAARATRGA